jgi:hypothetical protein
MGATVTSRICPVGQRCGSLSTLRELICPWVTSIFPKEMGKYLYVDEISFIYQSQIMLINTF